MVTIRRTREGDGPLLRDVRLRALRTDPDAFAASYDQAVTRDDHVWEEIAVAGSAGEEEIILLAEAEEGPVGMVGAFTRADEPGTRHLYGMWVAPEARSTGLGQRFVDAIREWSIEVGADEVKLWVVESNLPARTLYERAGFIRTGESQPLASNPSLTDVRMRLALS